jgi:glycosyltransferase involved in cell wall biosynthesis
MRILFLVYHGFSEASGISKKIHYQVKGLRENGYEVHLCYYDFDERGHRCRYVDGDIIKDYGRGIFAGLWQRIDYGCIYTYCKSNHIEFVYARCFQNANPFLIKLFKKLKSIGIKSVTEIPTYPYDQEFVGFPYFSGRFWLRFDKVFRNTLYKQMNAVVTFSDADVIFGQRTIRISNGVDFDSIPLHQYVLPCDGSVHLIGVAEVHYWHGFDRLIAGLGEYYKNNPNPRQIFFHIVGGVAYHEMHGSIHAPGFAELIEKYGIQDHVIFHGQLFGEELNTIFNKCCFAIGSLARHRSGITVIKTLKNREYATRGIPFVYSEQDSDFDNQSYVLKVLPDESPINIYQILDFISHNSFNPLDIRNTVKHLSWRIQMKHVINET